MDITNFIYPFINWWTFRLFLLFFLAIITNTSIHSHIKFLFGHMFSFLLAVYLGVELLGHTVTLFNF